MLGGPGLRARVARRANPLQFSCPTTRRSGGASGAGAHLATLCDALLVERLGGVTRARVRHIFRSSWRPERPAISDTDGEGDVSPPWRLEVRFPHSVNGYRLHPASFGINPDR